MELDSTLSSTLSSTPERVRRGAPDNARVPRISAFYGIVITMYFRDHPPPHFHARYGGYVAEIAIDALELIDGWLPPRALRLVLEWAREHQDELQANWDRARAHEQLVGIDPLP
jgi:Domain of unknown function (DUF4160)